MIFKRKEIKPPSVGSICTLRESALENMRKEHGYITNSVSYLKGLEQGYITKRSLRKNSMNNNNIELADSRLVYVLNEHPVKGIFKVMPLCIDKDTRSGCGMRHVLSKKITFLVKKDVLSLATQKTIDFIKEESLHYTASNYVENCIKNENIFNKPNFKWESNLIY